MTPDRRAELLLRNLRLERLPVDVWRVARRLGVQVQKADLGEDCSGVLVRHGATAIIGVHFGHHPNRQRFSLSHELGHFVLHKGGTYVDRGTYLRFRNSSSGSGTDEEERDANQFAAALLMPSKLLRQEFEQPLDPSDEFALTELAAKFGVSVQALTFRLRKLGFLKAELDSEVFSSP